MEERKNVTIFMPVSRDTHLHKVFATLEMLECKREKVNLLVIVDGKPDLYVTTRNFVEQSKFAERLCVEFTTEHKKPKYDILGRRLRIADIHNQAKQYIQDCDYIFGLEDDTVVPTNALTVLLKDYAFFPHAGMITGVQVARWGIPHIGAWKCDDVYNPHHLESVRQQQGLSTPWKDQVQEIDAGGFFCYLTKKENFINHEYAPFGGKSNVLGPDVNYGIELRKEGLLNYIDWSVKTIHKTDKDDITVDSQPIKIVEFRKNDQKWTTTQHI